MKTDENWRKLVKTCQNQKQNAKLCKAARRFSKMMVKFEKTTIVYCSSRIFLIQQFPNGIVNILGEEQKAFKKSRGGSWLCYIEILESYKYNLLI